MVTDPDKYKVVLENERVRVLKYTDKPGSAPHPIIIPTPSGRHQRGPGIRPSRI
jgi:hypothetical protein